jgi:hypothetical protein
MSILQAQYVDDEEKETDVVKEEGSDYKKWFYGGNFMVAFGNPTFVLVNPRVGYRVKEPLILGMGYTYVYYRANYSRSPAYTVSTQGPGLFGMYFFENPIFASTGVDLFVASDYNYWWNKVSGTNTFVTHQMLIGGGVVSGRGGRPMLMVGVYYDVLYSTTSVLPSPWHFRIGFAF